MTALYPYLDPRRVGRLTSTDAAAVLGLSRWRGAIDVQERMRAELAGKPYARKELGGPDIERGTYLEPGILAWTGQRLGRTTQPGRFEVHRLHPWLGSSNDGFTLGDQERLVEIKCPRRDDGWGDEGTDEIPDHYLAQVMVEMAVFEVSADVVLFVHGDIRIYPVERDIEAETELINALDNWRIRHVVHGEPVPVDGTAAYGEHLARRFAAHSDAMRQATVESRRWMAQLREARALAAKAEELELEARNHLCAEIGDAQGIACPIDGWRVTWKETKGTRKTNWQDVASECHVPQEVIERHTRIVGGGRRFLPKFTKEDK